MQCSCWCASRSRHPKHGARQSPSLSHRQSVAAALENKGSDHHEFRPAFRNESGPPRAAHLPFPNPGAGVAAGHLRNRQLAGPQDFGPIGGLVVVRPSSVGHGEGGSARPMSLSGLLDIPAGKPIRPAPRSPTHVSRSLVDGNAEGAQMGSSAPSARALTIRAVRRGRPQSWRMRSQHSRAVTGRRGRRGVRGARERSTSRTRSLVSRAKKIAQARRGDLQCC